MRARPDYCLVDDLGWTCKFGRTAEWRPYHEDPELNAAIDSEHDMICVIKQQAYKNLQRAELQRREIATAALSYASFHSLGAFHNASEREGLASAFIRKGNAFR